MSEEIILVDENDKQVGTGEKMDVHQKGLLHRCFSIVIFNSEGEMLLQKRATGKYHAGGLWTNACCSHPRPGKDIKNEAEERLFSEMGLRSDLCEIFSFVYRAEFENGLVEHEFDHVFQGKFDGEPRINPEEASGWRWVSVSDLKKEIEASSEKFTPWFRLIVKRMTHGLIG
ncbi:MAG: isopentenyl-diphosphate Delta-isomerase [Candidatus Pacebacteria bacterium]|nr:isopentenyl-diphosphate Delta-isomerase [Candidatus Paceibacterota bacterium]MDR3583630.1 isopentenyl-diphosphate Delta-isomerase [Candidatus Paceibacterota bacterium]